MRLRSAIAPFIAAAAALTVLPTGAGAVTLSGVSTDGQYRQHAAAALAPNEESGHVTVSTSPDVDASGAFVTPTTFEDLVAGATSLQIERALSPGTYYAMATAYDRVTYDRYRAPIVSFVVPAMFEEATTSLKCVGRRQLVMQNSWRTNVPDLKYAAVVRHGRKVVASEKYTEYLISSEIGTPTREDSTWVPFLARAFAKNATYTVTVTVTGPGVSYKRVVAARCR